MNQMLLHRRKEDRHRPRGGDLFPPDVVTPHLVDVRHQLAEDFHHLEEEEAVSMTGGGEIVIFTGDPRHPDEEGHRHLGGGALLPVVGVHLPLDDGHLPAHPEGNHLHLPPQTGGVREETVIWPLHLFARGPLHYRLNQRKSRARSLL